MLLTGRPILLAEETLPRELVVNRLDFISKLLQLPATLFTELCASRQRLLHLLSSLLKLLQLPLCSLTLLNLTDRSLLGGFRLLLELKPQAAQFATERLEVLASRCEFQLQVLCRGLRLLHLPTSSFKLRRGPICPGGRFLLNRSNGRLGFRTSLLQLQGPGGGFLLDVCTKIIESRLSDLELRVGLQELFLQFSLEFSEALFREPLAVQGTLCLHQLGDGVRGSRLSR